MPLLKAFSAEKTKLKYKALKNERARSGMHFLEHILAVEIDEKGILTEIKTKKMKEI